MKLRLLTILMGFGFVFTMCKTEVKPVVNPSLSDDGLFLSKKYCGTCHLYPIPELLDKKTWHQSVLPRMAAFLGIFTDNQNYYDQMPAQWFEPGKGGQRVKDAGVYPSNPLLSKEEWIKIRDYYIANAPSSLPENQLSDSIKVGIPNFITKKFNLDQSLSPVIQSLYVDSMNHEVYFAEMNGSLFRFHFGGSLRENTDGKEFFVEMIKDDEQIYLLDMGTRIASDNPQGKLLRMDRKNNYRKEMIMKDLMRPVSFTFGQLDEDLQEEIVICEYGNLLGQLTVYDQDATTSYRANPLMEDDGYIKAYIEDMNADGKNDIVALQGNGDEGIDIFWNAGGLKFKRDRILKFLPTNGSTFFEMLDFNQDGHIDLLYCSGDNGDYEPINKPYHGIYLYESYGNNSFKEKLFLPMYGVYQASAWDFDDDGDKDIIAVSFHPDFTNQPKGSFVYFENQGQYTFEKYTIAEYNHSRWMRFAMSDIDSDGDQDILLTAMNIKTPDVPAHVADKWRSKDLPVLLIENQHVK